MNATAWIEHNRPMQVLIVDDDYDMLNLLAATVKRQFGEQACVESVADSATAREKLDSGLIDVLVTDLSMPGITGLQLLRHAKRRNAWTQVVVVTGHSDSAAITDAMDLGASDYLVKPIQLVELKRVLAEAAARLHRWRESLTRTLVVAETH